MASFQAPTAGLHAVVSTLSAGSLDPRLSQGKVFSKPSY